MMIERLHRLLVALSAIWTVWLGWSLYDDWEYESDRPVTLFIAVLPWLVLSILNYVGRGSMSPFPTNRAEEE